jgi:hypothetical protein
VRIAERPDREPDLVAETSQLIGVWADVVRVTYGVGGCTLDFLREDSLLEATLILVARVTLSHYETEHLIEGLDAAVSAFAQASLEQDFDGGTPADEMDP